MIRRNTSRTNLKLRFVEHRIAHGSMSGARLLSADYKAQGGKLLRVRLREKDERIDSVRISGDFFLIPEDSLPKLEKMLEDVPLREKELTLLVDRFFRGTSAQGLGVTPDDFVKAILAAKTGETGS
jgi:lipoate---protein ligase